VETALRRGMIVLVWVGLLPLGEVLAQGPPGLAPGAGAGPEILPGTPPAMPASPAPNQEGWVVGQQQPGADSVFGNLSPAGCENCGGGNCEPPCWSFENDVRLDLRGRARATAFSVATANQAGLALVSTNVSGVNTYQVSNQTTVTAVVIDTHDLNMDVSPEWRATLAHYLGRDGNDRDHFIEVSYYGLDRWNSSERATGNLNPQFTSELVTSTQLANGSKPSVQGFSEGLVSRFPQISDSDVQNGRATAQELTVSNGFNNVANQELLYSSNFNSCELNTRIVGHNPDDRLLLNPNGRWYRECQTGLQWSYLFGLRLMVLDEKAQFLSAGHAWAAVTNPANGIVVPEEVWANSGQYDISTENILLGLQTGAAVEYRFCKWSFDLHGKVGPYVNVAEEESHVRASTGDPFALPTFVRDGAARRAPAAVCGEFGFTSIYRFNPNWTGRVSYDFMWLSNLALAPEQFNFQVNPAERINTAGAMFFNGVTLGLEYEW